MDDDDRIERLQRLAAGVDRMNLEDAQALLEALEEHSAETAYTSAPRNDLKNVCLDGWFDFVAVAAAMRRHVLGED